TIMLTAGDEFGRSQQGNNNAYAQDNAISWIDWQNRDVALEDFTAGLVGWRSERADWFAQFPRSGDWLALDGEVMTAADWEDPAGEGVGFRSSDPDAPYAFTIERRVRSVRIGEVR
ncbi:MAG: glycogen debranching enzyme, partial [Novosphingobium sp.]